MLLCIFLFDDAALRRLDPGAAANRGPQARAPRAARAATVTATALALIVVPRRAQPDLADVDAHPTCRCSVPLTQAPFHRS